MSNERLEKTKQRLSDYYEAEIAILSSQSYSISGKTLTRANLKEVQEMIKILEGQVSGLENKKGNRKTRRIIPTDI